MKGLNGGYVYRYPEPCYGPSTNVSTTTRPHGENNDPVRLHLRNQHPQKMAKSLQETHINILETHHTVKGNVSVKESESENENEREIAITSLARIVKLRRKRRKIWTLYLPIVKRSIRLD